MRELKKAYQGVGDILVRYWTIYGGVAAMARSPYMHVSILLTALTANSWINEKWWFTVISVLPNLLGFTLGGFAIFLGFGEEKFREVISGADSLEAEDYSPYLSVSSTFLHFVMVQIAALLWALVASALYFDWPDPRLVVFGRALGLLGAVVGYWLFLYSICLASAAGMAIFRVAGWYEAFQTLNRRS